MNQDIRACRVWERGQQAFLDLRAFDSSAYRYLNKSFQQCHVINEQEKKRAYNEREFCKLNMVHLHLWFFNLWKCGEGMPYVLFKVIQFIVGETWFTKINNHELDTKNNLLCFVEIQLALLTKRSNSVQKGCGVLEWCFCFWINFSNSKTCVTVFVN